MRLFGNMEVKNNTLYIGGISAIDLVKEHGSPLYVMDEGLIRKNCREYYKDFKVEEMGNKVAYAGKAFLTKAMCRLVKEEGLYLDVVSGGELYTAYKSEFPMDKVYFHGNNKTIDEIQMGIDLGVGRFVVDNFGEIDIINEIAREKGIVQKIILRISPGIEAHTHDYIKTGQVDSKFGFTLIEDEAFKAVEKSIKCSNINLAGLHCHIGSQIFETTPFEDEVDIMLELVNDIYEKFDYKLEELDLGGGFGIYYKTGDKAKTAEEYCNAIINRAIKKAKELKMELPILTIEPGRSIVGNAGITLYTVGAIKDIPNIRKYVSVDGGMTDNIRPALYNAEYECLVANNVYGEISEKITIAGKCCESGDILLTDIVMPQVNRGDILAVLSTGAYGYAMCNNYNKTPKPPVVFVSNGSCRLVCKRQSYEDLLSNEI
ncbi:diaminopimelate decarboxylase [Clostridium sp. MSJ-11]|uniref:Diaminopimelate decarboxylase n=1 Tax=Clostridium mobile TaxID=2841512 RepID=A0ABS6EJ84_9CLOT|nr:diaminopimelate decarboxylase [Clostridium mobile]MBU5485280.1 diaminopimelate decarboxylase [Clostridium mobile]